MKKQVGEMVSRWFGAEDLRFDDEINQEEGTVVNILRGIEQSAPEWCAHIVEPLVILFILDNEDGIVEPGEPEIQSAAIEKADE